MWIQRLLLIVALASISSAGCSPSTEYAYCVRHPKCIDLVHTNLHSWKEGRWEYILVEHGTEGEAIIEIKLLSEGKKTADTNAVTVNSYCELVNNAVKEAGLRGNVQIRIVNSNNAIVNNCSSK
jgi:hypothetical protein